MQLSSIAQHRESTENRFGMVCFSAAAAAVELTFSYFKKILRRMIEDDWKLELSK